tara:strand:+ start:490 stop:960 length:471 start_codon:yes stop_codon:yes gene_type:complete
MGVSGSGKSTLGNALGKAFSIPFIEGDDFHPQSNINKMKQGIPLKDEDRRPWLVSLSEELNSHKSHSAVLSCSALKISHRELLSSLILNKTIFWIYLKCSFKKLEKRIKGRSHFMPISLLKSQLDTLEEPKGVLCLKDALSLKEMIEQVKIKINEY